MITKTLTSHPEDSDSNAAVSVVNEALEKYKKGTHSLHIIFTHIIEINHKWKATIDIATEAEADDIETKLTSYCHLPHKHYKLYDILLPEVDHINMIEDHTSWEEIESQLLDIFFFDAVHDQDDDSGESGGGDKGNQLKSLKSKPEFDALMNDFNPDESSGKELEEKKRDRLDTLLDNCNFELKETATTFALNEHVRLLRENLIKHHKVSFTPLEPKIDI